ncbi:branched-chain amino acid ABC transporter substrate-binding protein [Chryseobacterium fluminis]|uniref:branched-chain amino acid ABC transporter substrate-binding protein n=1 Tax=Chryseobacterium fluminis TaxID=2983606 RepID=UPI00225B2C78|nr:branched-chain amino acid ABC transporter substrate-binding protein [Chryseobacterium sp. MMS21-Ot14]UZT97617.1 branched-chain amino acid ABC transporter substrate-binding protein [Chryseobacterium sp. MMS21-Ot14]
MQFDFFDIVEGIGDIFTIFGDGKSSSKNLGYDKGPKTKKKSKYIVEKISAGFLLIASILLFIVIKDILPLESEVNTILVISLIGLGISFIFFFVLHVLELYYFKSIFQLLLFSVSSILMFTSLLMTVYFRSGIF